MTRGNPHPPEVKAAVIADLTTGMSPAQVAKKHGVSVSRAQEWKQQTQAVAIIEPKKVLDLGELLSDALSKSIAALSAIADHARDKSWLKEQSASDLAILYGVLADKTVRVLAAAEQPGDAGDGR